MEGLESLLSLGANLGSAVALGYYACMNREGTIRKWVKEHLPAIGEAYVKISPTLEHFVWGYAITAAGYAMGDLAVLSAETQGFSSDGSTLQCMKNTVGGIAGGFAVVIDFMSEGIQAIERRKILPEQFLGTCAGVLTAVAVNNMGLITQYVSNLFS